MHRLVTTHVLIVFAAANNYSVGCDGCAGIGVAGTPDAGADSGTAGGATGGGAVGGGATGGGAQGGGSGGGSTAPVCISGWCWENPRPTGVNLPAVWAAGPGDVWAAGEAGLILHFAGGGWTSYVVPHQRYSVVRGIAGDGTGTLVAGTDDGLMHLFDGGSWSTLSLPAGEDLTLIASLGPGQPFVLAGGAVDGPHVALWAPGTGLGPDVVVGAAGTRAVGLSAYPGEVWVGADDGVVTRLTVPALGGQTTSTPVPVGGMPLTGFCAQADGGMWAASSAATLAFVFSGGAWSPLPQPLGPGVATCSSDRAILVGNPDAGSDEVTSIARCAQGTCSLELVDAGYPYTPGFGTQHFPASMQGAFLRGDDAWVSGEGGAVFQSLGGAPWVSLTLGPRENLDDAWVDPDGTGFAVGEGGKMLRFANGAWSPYPTTSFGTDDIYFVQEWPAGGHVVGGFGGFRTLAGPGAPFVDVPGSYDDGGFFGFGLPRPPNGSLANLWVSDRSGGGAASILQWQTDHFVVAWQGAPDILSTFATDAGTAWFAGADSTVLHFDGAQLQPVVLPGSSGSEMLSAVVGRDDGDVFIASGLNLYHHLPDGGWDTPIDLSAAFGQSTLLNAVIDPVLGTLWLVGIHSASSSDVVALEVDGGVTDFALDFHGTMVRARLVGRELRLAGPAGMVLKRTLP